MTPNNVEKAKEIFQKIAEKLQLELVSVTFYPDGENGPTLEVLLDHDYQITLEEIEAFTEEVNPLLDEALDEDEEGYVLDIASGISEKKIPFTDLPKLVGEWLDVKIKKDGEKITMKLVEVKEDQAKFEYFQKGKKTKKVLTPDEIDEIKMGYKA